MKSIIKLNIMVILSSCSIQVEYVSVNEINA